MPPLSSSAQSLIDRALMEWAGGFENYQIADKLRNVIDSHRDDLNPEELALLRVASVRLRQDHHGGR